MLAQVFSLAELASALLALALGFRAPVRGFTRTGKNLRRGGRGGRLNISHATFIGRAANKLLASDNCGHNELVQQVQGLGVNVHRAAPKESTS